jgi:hypothetical protein
VRAMAEGEIATHSLIPGTCEPTATEGESVQSLQRREVFQ